MATLEVQPRETPGERPDRPVSVEVDDALGVHAEIIEDWIAPRQNWEFVLREGHDFGRANNVEGRLLFVAREGTSSLTFRLDQLDAAEDSLRSVAGSLGASTREEDVRRALEKLGERVPEIPAP